MQQMIEGLDNEVALLLFFTTAVIAVVFPLYIVRLFHPSEDRSYHDNQAAPPPPPETHNNDREEVQQGNVIDNAAVSNDPPPPPPHAPDSQRSNENMEPVVNNTSEGPTVESFIIKVKWHEETQEQNVNELVKLKELKQRCFPIAFEEGKLIRFIHAGKLLMGDDSTLQQLGIARPCVIQCVISEQNNSATASSPGSTGGGANNTANVDDLLELSSMMYIFYGAVIIGSWTILFMYDDWVSSVGMFLLSFLSVIGFFLIFS